VENDRFGDEQRHALNLTTGRWPLRQLTANSEAKIRGR